MNYKFQSTLPARGATMNHLTGVVACDISIHAPRTGSDESLTRLTRAGSDFNPRSPHGERLKRRVRPGGTEDFNPRSPHGERRRTSRRCSSSSAFQSTLPARGATGEPPGEARLDLFQSTLPARGATSRTGFCCSLTSISIHAPRTGSDAGKSRAARRRRNFNPRSPHGERQRKAEVLSSM